MKDLSKRIALMEAALRSAESYLCEDLDAICDDVMREYAEDTLEDVRKGLKAAEEAREPKVYVLFTECVRDYEDYHTIEVFSSEEKAMEAFNEFVRIEKKSAEEYGWVVEESESSFESYNDGYYAEDRNRAEVYGLDVK